MEPPGDGVTRRDFVKVCTMAAAAVGLPAWTAKVWAENAAKGLKPSVIWLHFQECTGCTETLLRTSHPAVAELILDLVSLDYCETLFAAAGYQAEEALHAAMEQHAGKYICVIEGAIPLKDGGIYCKIGGKTAIDIVTDVASKAGALIAIGACASFGGLPAADPNPTGAVGAPEALKGKTVVTLPGCPPNPYNFLGTALQYATFGTLPALDKLGRPLFAYGRPSTRTARAGPISTPAGSCRSSATRGPPRLLPLQDRVQRPGNPRQLLHPAVRRSGRMARGDRAPVRGMHGAEASLARADPHDGGDRAPHAARRVPLHQGPQGHAGAIATGVAGLVGGALLGAGYMASKKLKDESGTESKKEA